MNKFAKLLLLPFSLVYGFFINLRNIFYDTGLLKETEFSIPIISVGNLSVGGAGKTPHVEYLIQFLNNYLDIGVLSRGYKRKTKGFRNVLRKDTAIHSGDEPVQFKRKHPNIEVAVSESRALGIPQMLKIKPKLQAIILDDAFQHRSVKPHINILITPAYDLYSHDILLPAGRLREPIDSAKRADIVIVSKCPVDFDYQNMLEIKASLNPLGHQLLLFSRYVYNQPYHILNQSIRTNLTSTTRIILISAIASSSYLLDHLKTISSDIINLEYEDHHLYSTKDMEYLLKVYTENKTENAIILTTEKDAIRLQLQSKFILEKNLPIFALPIKVEFLFDQGQTFNTQIKEALLNFIV